MLPTTSNMIIKTVLASGVALGLLATSTVSNAQANSSGFEFDRLEAEESNWDFAGEDESISVKDDLQELDEYKISDVEEFDVRLIEEDRRWGNRGDVEDYKLKTDVYDY